MVNKKYIGNWNVKGCLYEQNEENGKLHIEGTYTNGFAIAKFSLNRQNKGEYQVRGRLSLRSNRKNEVLKRIKEDGSQEPIAADIRLKSTAEEDIKAEIALKFESLVANNYDIVYKSLKETRVDDLTLSRALHVFGKEFMIEGKKVRQKTSEERDKVGEDDLIKQKLKKLNKVAIKLEQYPLSKIPQSALIDIKRETGKTTDDVFRDLCEFVAFLQRRNRYSGENPFVIYYEKNPKKTPKSAEDLVDALDRPDSLGHSVREKIYEGICLAPSDDVKETGVLMVFGAGLPVVDVCKMNWGCLLFGQIPGFPDSCQIKLWREKTTGATHDFTRPVFSFVASELKRRYEQLKEQDPNLDEKKVVGDLKSSQLTAYCRTKLLHVGVPYADIVGAKTKGSGGGVMLMRKDYHHRLTYECGIKNEAELKYLRMYTMNRDVTADCYCSKSSPSGQVRLQTALNRFTALEPKPKNVKIKEEKNIENGLYHVMIPPSDPERTTAAIFRVKMKPGEIFRIYSPEGLDGTVTVVSEKNEC